MSDGLPDLPSTGNLTGTHWELAEVERHYHLKWSKNASMGGLTERHRSEVLRHMIRLSKYALAVGATPEDLNNAVDLAIKNPEYP